MNFIAALATSRIGVGVLAFLAAWVLASWRTELMCESRHREAAAVELTRQTAAAKAIEATDLRRAGDDLQVERALRTEIQRLRDAQPHVTPRTPCVIDDAFARSVHQFDARAKRAPGGAK